MSASLWKVYDKWRVITMKPVCYLLEDRMKPKKLVKKISLDLQYSFYLKRSYTGRGKLRDTFDENLLRQKSFLLEYGGNLDLFNGNTGVLHTQSVEHEWLFAGDLSDGLVTRELSKLSSLRAFLAVADLEIEVWEGKLLDDLEKTTVKVKQWVLQHNEKVLAIGLLNPLRGYQQAFDDLAGGVKKFGGRPFTGTDQLLQRLDVPIRSYRSKPKVSLGPEDTICLSVRSIVQPLFNVIRANEQGILNDFDTEFLHDYRVSFRKIRALVSLCKGVFADEEKTALLGELAELMKRTGQLRDLDVCILQKQRFLDLVPHAVHEGVNILLTILKRKGQKSINTSVRDFAIKNIENK